MSHRSLTRRDAGCPIQRRPFRGQQPIVAIDSPGRRLAFLNRQGIKLRFRQSSVNSSYCFVSIDIARCYVFGHDPMMPSGLD
jgi:hypothetical protein